VRNHIKLFGLIEWNIIARIREINVRKEIHFQFDFGIIAKVKKQTRETSTKSSSENL
jgi:hypothetical protein